MFPFASVALPCEVVAVVFIATIGWRLILHERALHDTGRELQDLDRGDPVLRRDRVYRFDPLQGPSAARASNSGLCVLLLVVSARLDQGSS